jgi:hypothetical protein
MQKNDCTDIYIRLQLIADIGQHLLHRYVPTILDI